MRYRLSTLASIATLMALAAPAPGLAQEYQVGDSVEGCGFTGKIVEIKPRAGWDVPFYVIRSHRSLTFYDINCTPEEMRTVPANAPAAPPNQRQQTPPRAQPIPQQQVANGGEGLCRPGAKLEGRWGAPWYEVTVLGPLDASGNCPVRFDGYGAMWDNSISSDLLRPRGGGQVQRPTNRVADTPPATRAGGRVPDGSYQCVKILGDGQPAHIGTLNVRGGRANLIGKPAGWTMTSLYMGGTDPWGKRIAVYEFTTPTGRDRLDCTLP